MSLFLWVVFGFLAGSAASYISPNPKGGIIGSIVLGVIGAVVGGFFGEMIFGLGVTGFNFISFLIAVAGALLVLFVGRLLMRA